MSITDSRSSTSTLIVGGVPEHFNSPFHLGLQQGTFEKHGVQLTFKEVPEGTGKMCAGLKDGTLDVAVLLTEGIVRDIAQGSSAKLIATYVTTPLTWAVLASPSTADTIKSIEDLKGKTLGISRFGSGSHLMSFVMADENGWNVEAGDLKYEIHNDFAGLRAGVNSGKSAAFMWEHFMTKPYCDKGELRKIGEIVTPWPCFMIAAREEVLQKKYHTVANMIAALQESCVKFKSDEASSVKYVSEKFHLKQEDATAWFNGVEYSKDGALSRRVLVRTVDVLVRAKILPTLHPRFSFASYYDARANIAEIDSAEISTMKLFYDKRMLNELRVRGKEKGPLEVSDLADIDQLHYFGKTAVDETAVRLGFVPNHRVLDVGSGLGGPARYMAWKYKVKVDALEIQLARHDLAKSLTQRTGMELAVKHLLGDAATYHLHKNAYEHVVSWLAILHIRDRNALFQSLHHSLVPGGNILIDDFVQLHPFTDRELSDLKIAVACPVCPTVKEYTHHLSLAGFVDIQVEDVSAAWKKFVADRLEQHEKQRDAFEKVHGEQITHELGYFYAIISNLFNAGNLGGLRITARKKGHLHLSH